MIFPWHGRRVLVTGADGFIGSHLTEALVHAGASVRAFCFYNSQGSHGWLDMSSKAVQDAVEYCPGDVRDARFVEAACQGMEFVFHLAALIAIPYSYQAPASFVETNVVGTLNVLEAVRRAGCRRLVHTSTSEVYGTPLTVPITEDHPLRGQSPYSASKIAADKLCEAYFCAYDLPVVTLRPFNTYGPRQSARAVVPTILVQLLSGRSVVRLGDPKPKRDLTFVDDTVAGFLAAGSAPGIDGQTIQLGTGRTQTIQEVFQEACRACGLEARMEVDPARVRPSRSEVLVLHADPSRAAELLEWRAAVPLDEGLRRTAEWMRRNLDRYRPDEYAI
jgi:UDP-glucose 4-epimerase